MLSFFTKIFFFKRHQIIDIKELKIKLKRRNVLGRKYYLIFQSNKGQEVIQYDEMVWSEDDFRELINHFEERNNQLNPNFFRDSTPSTNLKQDLRRIEDLLKMRRL